MKLQILFSIAFFIGTVLAQTAFDYQQPSSTWGANCGNPEAMRQSPINIVTSETVKDDDLLSPLEFDDQWNVLLDGTFSNNGLGVRFVADDVEEAATVRNHLGDYNVANVHFHWGPEDNDGTGHQLNGESFGVEIHFVTIRQGADLSDIGPDTEDGSVAVISVLAEAVDIPIAGVWAKLDPTMVTYDEDVINITDISWSMLLPANRAYYYYPGSQTSPGCWEFVHFFVMQNTIPVPIEYLAQLRTTRFDNGELITLNHRSIQPLNNRTVYRNGVSARVVMKPAMLILLAVLFFSIL